MIQILNSKNNDFEQILTRMLDKNLQINEKLEAIVSNLILRVKNEGDLALIETCNEFDGANFSQKEDLLVSKEEIEAALKGADPKIIQALNLAKERIIAYHKKQLPQDFEYEDEIGVTLGNRWNAIEKVGAYIPGGTAAYPSSVLMNILPAQIAGCKDIVLATPSNAGKVNQTVLVAANLCGIDKIYKIGGASAIAALAYGTPTIAKVDKIVGPGNAFVALAKKQLFGQIGIDTIAGPTDVLILADQTNDPSWIAADLLSQAEHGEDSQAILITDNENFATQVSEEISKILPKLTRNEIARPAIENLGLIIIVEDLALEGSKLANQIAPEHCQITCQNQEEIAHKIQNAGAIFLGQYSPEAIGDYIAGPSHTLPTLRAARFDSGLSVYDFLKRTSVISCSESGFNQLKEHAANLAASEGLTAHQLSINIRN